MNKQDISSPDQSLETSIDRLSKIINKRSSLGYRLLSGLITGAATAIGATVVAGGGIFLLSKMVQQLNIEDYPAIAGFLEKANLLDDVESSKDADASGSSGDR